jgi:hypothetical protein
MNRRFFRLATALSAAAAMLICGASAQAGVFSLTPFVSDATSGVSPANTYTHLIDWLGPGAVVNGVAFAAAPSQLGPNYALGSVPNALPDGSFNTPPFNVTVPPGDGFNSMFKSFFYGGGFPETVALFGLTPGKTYSTRFYSDPWGGPRVQDVESNGNRIVYDEDAVTQYLDYTFTATDTKNVVSFTIANGGSMHQYALSNQEVAAPLRPLPFVRATTLFNTGVDANGVPLPNGASGPHYVLTLNPDNTGPTPLVQARDRRQSRRGWAAPPLASGLARRRTRAVLRAASISTICSST